MFRLCLYIVLISALGSQGQLEGQSCVEDGATGECKLLRNCPKAIEELSKHKRIPQICSFFETDPVVCCVPSSAAPTSAPVTTKPTPPPTERPVAATVPNGYSYQDYDTNDYSDCDPIPDRLTAPRTGQKAWDKCIEYQEEYVYPCDTSPLLTGAKIRRNDCTTLTNTLMVHDGLSSETEFSFMALLCFGKPSRESCRCEGSILSDSFILTAGHCTVQNNTPVTHVLVGTVKISDDYNQGNLYEIAQIIKHPDYNSTTQYHDIALLQTETPMKLNKFLLPACLDTGMQDVNNEFIVGWSDAFSGGEKSEYLRKVSLSKISQEDCSTLMQKDLDPRTQTCYKARTGFREKWDCGLGGGPIQVRSYHIYCMNVVVGVRSSGCADHARIYTRVVEYLPWIESVVWP